MIRFFIKIQSLILILCGVSQLLLAHDHPNLILTQQGVEAIRQNRGTVPLFDKVLEEVVAEVEAEMIKGVKVPVPKDMAGGYTHEQHKRNFFILQKAGTLYQITQEEKYAAYIRECLLAYAQLFPTLPKHPTNRSYATGKIFWQCLNDANWLVYVSQAYDCVYNYLSEQERSLIEDQLFRPLADWVSIENPKFFNRIHNHSAWGNAAVGMIGLVMKDEALIQRALYGLEEDGLDSTMKDDDGGFIKIKGQYQAGFLAQMDYSFSPDGHFTEGPYYLRYAMTPFLLFAKALDNHRPEMNIFAYRDSILKKSIYSLLYETDAQGRFFPINDAQKGMSWKAREVVAAVDIAYLDFGQDPMLLSIASKQGKVTLDEAGLVTAAAYEKGIAIPFQHQSIAYRDGADGKHGGLGILRNEQQEGEEICLLFKYAAHGMGHGHFDKLSYSLYDEDGEVIQDYGSARWVNIDQKGGGRYLKENKSYAKQTIAHNTLVLNETSHYEGQVEAAESNHPDQYFFDVSNPDFQIASAKDRYAYPGVELHRTIALLKDENFRNPLLIDIFRVKSKRENLYDLPVWYQGHLLATNFDYQAATTKLSPLGEKYGYQHLWVEGEGKAEEQGNQLTWFLHQGNGAGQTSGKFFTITTSAEAEDKVILARIGANDPDFNLRHDPVFMQRRKASSTVFASVVESHGKYNPVSEIPSSPFSGTKYVEVLYDSDEYTVIQITHETNKVWILALANKDASKDRQHQLKLKGEKINWQGPFCLK